MTIINKDSQGREITYEVDFDSPNAELGYGGTGRVFRGSRIDPDSGIKRDVAIKFLYADLPQITVERARRETEIKISSENLVEMIDFIDVVDDGVHHYHVVSELLEGVLLSELLKGNLSSQDGKVHEEIQGLFNLHKSKPEQFAIHIIRNVLSGIMSLHDAGYLHRDIDPSNIMITNDGKVKLIDFGIAKKLNSKDDKYHRLTALGEFVGKASYAAPELVSGDLVHQNFTTDIYAIGILFYELVVNKLPFDGPAHEVLKKQLTEDIPVKDVKNKEIRKIIETATQKDQSRRYSSAFEFRVAIDQLKIDSKQPNPSFSSIHLNWMWIAGVIAVLAGFAMGICIQHLV